MKSKKTKKEILESFMRRNKEARERMAINAGFDNANEFKAHLLEGVKKDNSKEKANIDKIETPVDSSKTIAGEEVQNKLDMVIAFDTTGSMAGYINAVKTKVEEVIDNLFNNTTDLRIKIVAFGDYCDMKGVNKFGKAYQTIELTDDKSKLISFIKNAKNTSGGDGDEFYEVVIKKVNEETDWRKDAKKSVLLIGDAEPHRLGYSFRDFVRDNQIDWKVEAYKALDLGICWDTFTIHPHNSRWYQELSKITGGASLPFKSASKTNDVIEGLAYKRAGATAAYNVKVASMDASKDGELIGTFKTISKLD